MITKNKSRQRIVPLDVKVKKIKRVLAIWRAGYNLELACKRATVAQDTFTKWCKELGITYSKP